MRPEILFPLFAPVTALSGVGPRFAKLFERLAAESKPRERKAARALLPLVREERAKRAAEIARELQRWHAEEIPKRLRRLLA